MNKLSLSRQLRNYCQHNLRKKIDNLETNLLFRDGCQVDYGRKINPKYLISNFESRTEFLSVHANMAKEILEDPQHNEDEEFNYRLTDLLTYMISSRLNRGTLAWVGFKELEEIYPEKNFTENDRNICKFAGWSLEFLETYTCILDDFLDLSSDRRGMYCWYRFKGHGIISTYDAAYSKLLCNWVLDRYLKGHPAHVPITDFQHLVNFQVHMGQIATFTTDASKYNVWLYDNIVKHKTELFMYLQPLFLSFYSARIFDKDLLAELDAVTRVMGRLFQIQNDVYDCYGDPQSSGKIANDIQQGTCTWLIGTAMGVANKNQKKILVDNYGKEDPECEQRVKDMYRDIDIRGVYKAHKQDEYNKFMKMIKNGSDKMPKKSLLLCAHHATVPYLDHTEIETEFKFDDDWVRD